MTAMGVKEVKEDVCISGEAVSSLSSLSSERKIPSTVATQVQDNASKPFWSFKSDSSAADDFFDCYVAFKELCCHEYFWDWQGRKMDELIVKKLLQHYPKFFDENPIGKSCFVTYRADSGSRLEELGKMYLSIINTSDFASSRKIDCPPIFEVAHSVTAPGRLSRLVKLYNESVSIATDKFGRDCGPKVISVIPTHDFTSRDWYSSMKDYFDEFHNSFRCRADYFRPLIPRSSIADSVGFVSAVLATKRALASYSSFAKLVGISCHPIVEAGPLMFRGGLNPDSLRNFISTYPGARSVTITPAFRFDYGLEKVKESVSTLNRLLPKNKAMSFSQEDLKRIDIIEKIFTSHYRKALQELPDIDDIAESMRLVKKRGKSGIDSSFSFYSLGIPPELIGTGRAILDCIKEGLVGDLERFYPNIKDDLRTAGSLLNRENLGFLAKTGKGWSGLQKDAKLVEDYVDASIGPSSTEHFLHRNHTSNVFHLWSTHKDFSRDIIAAARLRHGLG